MSERDREHAGERPTGEIRRDGVAVSAGIAIGRAFLVGRDLIKEPRYHVEADDVDSEVARLRKATGPGCASATRCARRAFRSSTRPHSGRQ